MACLQHHRLGSNHPDTINRQELLLSGRVLQTRHDGVFQGLNLLAQTVPDRETAGDGPSLVGLGQPPLEVCLRSLGHPLGTETPARMAPEDVVQTEHVRGLLAHQVRALASRVPHGPRSLWVAVALGHHAQA